MYALVHSLPFRVAELGSEELDDCIDVVVFHNEESIAVVALHGIGEGPPFRGAKP